eukprot:TRINITY_DN3919_c0_g1_i1.p1 TRINITY_DN3919_c0_g1~~TRINITY_DN3919_c0_g1_i1.p1  ORF type:complete len:111 (+),score=37.73 TRINITY_DN3919_c0_g1_i1:31-333(+)
MLGNYPKRSAQKSSSDKRPSRSELQKSKAPLRLKDQQPTQIVISETERILAETEKTLAETKMKDRASGTGRGNKRMGFELKKEGYGKGNWGTLVDWESNY